MLAALEGVAPEAVVPQGKALQLPLADTPTGTPTDTPSPADTPTAPLTDAPADASRSKAVGTYGMCVIDLNVDHDRISSLVAGAVAQRLVIGGRLLAVLQMTNVAHPTGESDTLTGVAARLHAAGYGLVSTHHLFANGPCERTLVCQLQRRPGPP